MKKLQKWLKDYCNKAYTIKELKNLELLHLSNNKLTKLPKEIGNLKLLYSLELPHNHITTLPSEICELKNLEALMLQNNNLTHLPKEICELKDLNLLYIENNPNLKIFESQVEFLKKLEKGWWKVSDFEIIPDSELSGILYL